MSSAIRETIIGEDQFPVIVSHFSGGSGYRSDSSCHSELEFQFIVAGEGDYFIKDQAYRFSRDSVLLIHKDEIHSRLPGSCESVKRINLVIGPKYVKKHALVRDVEKSLADCHHIALPEKQATVVRMLMEEIGSECAGKSEYWEDVVSANIRKVLIMLQRSKSFSSSQPPLLSTTVAEVIDYLDHDFTRRVSLDELASRFCMSKFWLSRQFRAQTGISIRDYIIHKRIAMAKTLLETTDMKVISISASVGFEDLSTFNRDFRLRVGVTPSDYRKISS
jgi:AraC-like DNA-binding protein